MVGSIRDRIRWGLGGCQRGCQGRRRQVAGLGIALVLSFGTFAAQKAYAAPAGLARPAISAMPNRFDPTSRAASVKPAPATRPAPATARRAVGPRHPARLAGAGGQPAT